MEADQSFEKQAFGSNQHRSQPILADLPDLKTILQLYIDERVKQKDIPQEIMDDYGIEISLRSIQQHMKTLGVLTTRRSGLTQQQKLTAVAAITADDSVGRWGGRMSKHELALNSLHIPRDEVLELRRELDPEGVVSRDPKSRKVHRVGLWSIGSNEEWCVDGHEKMALVMKISVWGIIDKFSRMELGLFPVPDARSAELPPVLFLRIVKERGGIPLSITGDKGSELGKLVSLMTTMRQCFQPFLAEENLPAFNAVKSVYNITREWSWRPLWDKVFSNIVHQYRLGKAASGFTETSLAHVAISYWIWGEIVKFEIKKHLRCDRNHTIRKQDGILLPSGAWKIDMYSKPERFGEHYSNWLIPADPVIVDELLQQYDQPDLLLFGSAHDIAVCEYIYTQIGTPLLKPGMGWEVFATMVNKYRILEFQPGSDFSPAISQA